MTDVYIPTSKLHPDVHRLEWALPTAGLELNTTLFGEVREVLGYESVRFCVPRPESAEDSSEPPVTVKNGIATLILGTPFSIVGDCEIMGDYSNSEHGDSRGSRILAELLDSEARQTLLYASEVASPALRISSYIGELAMSKLAERASGHKPKTPISIATDQMLASAAYLSGTFGDIWMRLFATQKKQKALAEIFGGERSLIRFADAGQDTARNYQSPIGRRLPGETRVPKPRKAA